MTTSAIELPAGHRKITRLDDLAWHLINEHGHLASEVNRQGLDALEELHRGLDHSRPHLTSAQASRARRIAATSEEAYEAACDKYNDFMGTYQERRTALIQQLNGLDEDWNTVTSELREHEDHGGIPLWNRCVYCRGGYALPRDHEGPCR